MATRRVRVVCCINKCSLGACLNTLVVNIFRRVSVYGLPSVLLPFIFPTADYIQKVRMGFRKQVRYEFTTIDFRVHSCSCYYSFNHTIYVHL